MAISAASTVGTASASVAGATTAAAAVAGASTVTAAAATVSTTATVVSIMIMIGCPWQRQLYTILLVSCSLHQKYFLCHFHFASF